MGRPTAKAIIRLTKVIKMPYLYTSLVFSHLVFPCRMAEVVEAAGVTTAIQTMYMDRLVMEAEAIPIC